MHLLRHTVWRVLFSESQPDGDDVKCSHSESERASSLQLSRCNASQPLWRCPSSVVCTRRLDLLWFMYSVKPSRLWNSVSTGASMRINTKRCSICTTGRQWIAFTDRVAYTTMRWTSPQRVHCCNLLARALQAFSDPYCHSTCSCLGNFDAKCLRN